MGDFLAAVLAVGLQGYSRYSGQCSVLSVGGTGLCGRPWEVFHHLRTYVEAGSNATSRYFDNM